MCIWGRNVNVQENELLITSYSIEYGDPENKVLPSLEFVTDILSDEIINDFSTFFTLEEKAVAGEIRYARHTTLNPRKHSFGTIISVNPNFITATINPTNHFDIFSEINLKIEGLRYNKSEATLNRVLLGEYFLKNSSEDINTLLVHAQSASHISLKLQFAGAERFILLRHIRLEEVFRMSKIIGKGRII